jgi:hypothetical protein
VIEAGAEAAPTPPRPGETALVVGEVVQGAEHTVHACARSRRALLSEGDKGTPCRGGPVVRTSFDDVTVSHLHYALLTGGRPPATALEEERRQ